MDMQYKDAIFHPVVALIKVVMHILSVFTLSKYRKRKLLYSTIQIVAGFIKHYLETQTLIFQTVAG